MTRELLPVLGVKTALNEKREEEGKIICRSVPLSYFNLKFT